MFKTLRNWLLVGMVFCSLSALVGCNGDGGGTIAPPGDGTPPPGDGTPPPGDQQPGPTTPTADTFSWTGNTPLTVVAAQGLLANDPAGAVITAAATTSALGGTVNVNTATGAFTYNPPVGVPAGVQTVAVPDTFTYTVAGFDPTTVTINLTERIWYVNGSLQTNGNGTFGSPFNTLAAAELASDANDTIFVFTGTPAAPTDAGQNLGIDLQAGQKLLGQGVPLSFNDVPIVDSLPNAPVISNIGLAGAAEDIPVVMLATGNAVAGLTINAAFNEGILALGGAGHNLHDNTITFGAGGNEGIRLLSVPESNLTGNHLVASNTITGSPRDGIKLVNNELQDGTATLALMSATVTISRNTITGSAQDGITVNLNGTGAGAGTNVTLNVLTNAITNSGTAGANEGINIDSLGDANVTTVISRNTVANSSAEAIVQGAAATSAMNAFVANNDLSASGQNLPDFHGRVVDTGATFCLELLNNFTAAAINSTFLVENNGGVAADFRFFEPVAGDPEANDALAVRNPPNLFTNILQGGCNIPLDGAILFEANCAKCHTGNGLGLNTRKVLIAKDITNATTVLINDQMVINGSMIQEFLPNGRLRLTQAEIAAIAAALVPAP